MKKFRVTVSYDGLDTIEIEAKNKKEAEELVFNGDWEEKDIVEKDGKYYEIIETEEVKI